MKKYRLKGHETFAIREGWLNKGLYEVNKNSLVFKENYGSDALGVGSNMAKAIRFWLKAANLTVEKKDGVYLSEMGKIILQSDPYFEDYFSLWIVHCNIVMNKEMVTSWNLFFNEFEEARFDREDIAEFIKRRIEIEYEAESISERSIRDDVSVLINMYLKSKEDIDPEDKKSSPFAEFGLLKRDVNAIQKARPNRQTLNEYVILYCICEYIDENKGISIEDILNKSNMPGKILGINRIMLNEYLDILSYKGELYVNHTAGLDMVYGKKRISKEDVLREYYKMAGEDKNE